MFWDNRTLMGTEYPAFKKAGYSMNTWHRYMGWIARRGKYSSLMQKPVVRRAIVPSPSVRAYGSSFGNDVTDKWLEIGTRCIWNVAHTDSSKALWLLYLSSYHYDGFAGTSPSFSSLLDSTHKGLVDLDRSRQPVTNFF